MDGRPGWDEMEPGWDGLWSPMEDARVVTGVNSVSQPASPWTMQAEDECLGPWVGWEPPSPQPLHPELQNGSPEGVMVIVCPRSMEEEIGSS